MLNQPMVDDERLRPPTGSTETWVKLFAWPTNCSPDVTFIHSSFDEYVQAVESALPEQLSTVTGELTSQETDGWYTLANTSSSRIYLKQAFQENSNLLEQVVEPLTIITGGHNHKDQLTYAWKTLLQNAPR